MKKWKKYMIPTVAATVISAISATPMASADSNDDYMEERNIRITAEESKNIALEKIPGTVEEVELDEEDGFFVYEVEVETKDGKEYEFMIDAQTGEILDFESDGDD